jgi:hypothetical protein
MEATMAKGKTKITQRPAARQPRKPDLLEIELALGQTAYILTGIMAWHSRERPALARLTDERYEAEGWVDRIMEDRLREEIAEIHQCEELLSAMRTKSTVA